VRSARPACLAPGPRSAVAALAGALLAVVVALAAAGCAATVPAPPAAASPAGGARSDEQAIDRLLAAMRQRLDVAIVVARIKWNSGAPIEDLPRERQILDRVAAAAPAHGLEPARAREFFQAQIDAGKLVQRALHGQWRAAAQPPFPDAGDLARDVRPVLDRLEPELLDALAGAATALALPGAADRLAPRARASLAPFDADAIAAAIAPLPVRAAQTR